MALAYQFVLEELQSFLSPDRLRVKPMFGSHALYVDEKIIFILRRKATPAAQRDDGVWVALADPAHAASLSKDFPTLRGIDMFQQRAFNDWFNLPEHSEGFEESALALCQLIARRDARIGKIPKPRKKKKK